VPLRTARRGDRFDGIPGAVRIAGLPSGDSVYDAPQESLALLWGAAPRKRRGKVPGFTVGDVVGAAIALADSEGLSSVSMRRTAEALQLTPMALYTYVPSKTVLVAAMIEEVCAEVADLPDPVGSWRERIAAVAWANWDLYMRHPWLLSVTRRRSVAGPNRLRKLEFEFRAIRHDGVDPLYTHDAIHAYVYGAVRAGIDERDARNGHGPTAAQWWETHEPYLDQVLDPNQFPELSLLLTAARQSSWEPSAGFEFGLSRLIDGLEAYAGR
jgi:AcrR family transcriptional regulator